MREDNAVLQTTVTYLYDKGGNIVSKTVYPFTTGTALGTALVNYTYDAWGAFTMAPSSPQVSSTDLLYVSMLNPVTYRGYFYDLELGLYYLQSRYYDPETGRFISADDIQSLRMEDEWMRKVKRLVFRSVLAIAIIIPIGIILHDAIVYVVDEKEKETATGTQDTTGFLADYDRNIFGKYRFNRGNSIHQEIYAEVTNNDGTNHEILVSGGTIEKLMHDGERYIAYHFTEDVEADEWNGVMQTGSDEQYYAILDTQTKQTEKFADIETLSAAILERQIHFGNWFYTYAQDSSEGIRTPLLGEYSYEYLDSVHGQSILRREVPIFFGVLANVQTDGERYIAFRERIIHDTAAPWYDDPVTNALLSATSEKRIGLYRRSFLVWFSVYYDRYVLFDTQSDAVREFNKERELESFCDAKRIFLHLVNIRKI